MQLPLRRRKEPLNFKRSQKIKAKTHNLDIGLLYASSQHRRLVVIPFGCSRLDQRRGILARPVPRNFPSVWLFLFLDLDLPFHNSMQESAFLIIRLITESWKISQIPPTFSPALALKSIPQVHRKE